MSAMADRLLDAMRESAARQYGTERVTELAHALQCADLAAEAGSDEEMVVACLLHDVGRYAVAQEGISDTLEQVAAAHGVTVMQVAIAWLLARSPVMLPIPGTSSVAHLEEDLASARLQLSPADLKLLG